MDESRFQVYDIVIRVVANEKPTDLELGDICLQLADSLESPVVEGIDGRYVPADFFFAGWRLELFEENGDRVWAHSVNADFVPPISESPQPPPSTQPGLPYRRLRRLFPWRHD